MQKSVGDYVTDIGSILNGSPTWGKDALAVDAYSTYLASGRKWIVPVQIGTALDATNTATAIPFQCWIPAYTMYVSVGVQATGLGVVRVTCTDDAKYIDLPVYADLGTPDAAHSLPFWTGSPVASPGSDGLNRPLNVTFQSSPRRTDFTVQAIDDASGTIQVWSLMFRFWALVDNTTLVA